MKLCDLSIFLDLPILESIKRRDKITYNNEDDYNKEVLIPMHKKYVLPAREKANLNIDVVNNSVEEVYDIVLKELVRLNLLS